jgi:hypothetical protein
MNCERVRELLLLTASGEAPADSRDLLDRHLANCPDCRLFDAETRWILAAAADAPLETDVSEWTLARIAAAAQDGPPPAIRAGRRAHPAVRDSWRPALAYAAAALVMVGLGIGYLRRAAPGPEVAALDFAAPATPVLAWDPALDQELDTLDAVLTLAFEDVEEPAPESAEDIVTELARLEGWEI